MRIAILVLIMATVSILPDYSAGLFGYKVYVLAGLFTLMFKPWLVNHIE